MRTPPRPALLPALAALAILAAVPAPAEAPPVTIVVGPGGSPGFARLILDTEPGGARVRIDGAYAGRTPMVVDRLGPGPHAILLSLEGYRDREIVLVAAELTDIEATVPLEAALGWLELRTTPPDALVEVDGNGRWLPAGLLQLPAGPHSLRISRFAFDDATAAALVVADATRLLRVDLVPAAFRLSELRATRRAFSPRNAGVLGATELSFSVSSYGAGRASVLDAVGTVVYGRGLGPFAAERQSFLWDGRGPDGPLPDGEYRVVVEVEPAPGVKLDDPSDGYIREAIVVIDSTLVIVPRGFGAAGPGLALMPDVFPSPPASLAFALGASFAPLGTAGPAPAFGFGLSTRAAAFALRASAGADSSSWAVDGSVSIPLFSGGGFAATGYLAGGGGEGSASLGKALPFPAAAEPTGGAGLGLALAAGGAAAWLGAAPELRLAWVDGVAALGAGLRAGASAGGPAWRLGVSAELGASFGPAGVAFAPPRLAAEAHVFLAPAPLSLSLEGSAELGAGGVPESPSVTVSAGLSI